MKTKYFIALSISVILIFAIAFSINFKHKKLIGDQTDEYGCLIGAGYSWNWKTHACIRSWELDENQTKAVGLSTFLLSFPVTILEVNKQPGEGNYIIKMQRNDNRENFEIDIKNWSFPKKISNSD
jgi:hypothetical protein